MRSTSFVFFSLLIHGFCVAALLFLPTRTVGDKESPIEVTMAPQADQPGQPEAVAPPAPTPQPPPPAQVEAPKPVAPPVVAAMPKPVWHKPAKAKAVATPQPVKLEQPPESADVAQEYSSEEAAPTPSEPNDEKAEFVPVKETPPVGVEAAKEPQVEPAPVAAAPASGQGEAALAKGGATQEGAVSYLDLKQAPGNKAPSYPINARLEKRQGQVELVYRVTKEGKVADIQVAKSSGSKDLDNEAVRAIGQFHFVPGQEGWAHHPVNFTLKGPVAALPSRLRTKGAQND
jgi:protein TonB